MSSVPGSGFMSNLNGLLSGPQDAGMMGAAMGLLQSSGASRLPVTMGAALGNALGSSQTFQQRALQNYQSQLALRMMLQRMGLIKAMSQWLTGGGNTPASAKPATANPATANPATTQGPSNGGSNSPASVNPATANPATTQGPSNGGSNSPASVNPATTQRFPYGGRDIAPRDLLPDQSISPANRQLLPHQSTTISAKSGQNAQTQTVPSAGASPLTPNSQNQSEGMTPDKLQKLAMIGSLLGISPTAFDAAASNMLKTGWTPLSQAQAASVIPGGVKPGYVALYNRYTGQIQVVGQNPYQTVSTIGPYGNNVTSVIDTRKLGGNTTPASVPPSAVPIARGVNGGAYSVGNASPVVFSGGANPQVGASLNDTAHLIANYQMAPPSGYAMSRPAGQALMGRVQQINPTYNALNYDAAHKTMLDFATGTQGNAVRSFNVALQHLSVLDNLASALGTHNERLINSAKQLMRKQFGSSAPTNFDAAKQLVADEIQKAVAGVPGGEGERENLMDQVSSASSPAQLHGVINTFQRLMVGQLNGLRDQYRAGTDMDNFMTKYLSPVSRQVYNRVSAENLRNETAPATSKAPYPNGTRLQGPNGRVYVVKNGVPVLESP